jgi:hypothetical protein
MPSALPAAATLAEVIDVHGRQVLHLLLGEVEPDSVLNSGHGTDRDGDFLVPPQMALLEQHVAHLVIARVDEEALHPPDVPIDGMDTVTGAELYLALRDNVLNDRLGLYRLGAHAGAEEIDRAGWRVCPTAAVHASHKVPFLGAIELVELCARTAQPDFPGRSLDQVDRNKPGGLLLVAGLDHKVSDRISGRVDDQTAHLAARTI